MTGVPKNLLFFSYQEIIILLRKQVDHEDKLAIDQKRNCCLH